MNVHQRTVPALLTGTARVATAVAVAGVVAVTWLCAGNESQQAVAHANAALTRTVTHVTLPAVDIVASRAVQVAASAARFSALR